MLKRQEVLRLVRKALDSVNREIELQSGEGKFAAGLASEGYAGGYRDCLCDVEAALTHGTPNRNSRYMWK